MIFRYHVHITLSNNKSFSILALLMSTKQTQNTHIFSPSIFDNENFNINLTFSTIQIYHFIKKIIKYKKK